MNTSECTTQKEISDKTSPTMSQSLKSDQSRSTPSTDVDNESRNQINSREDYPQDRPLSHTDTRETDSELYVSSCEDIFSSSIPNAPGTVTYDGSTKHHDKTAIPDSKTQVTSSQAHSRSDRPHRNIPTKQSPSLLGRVGGFLAMSTGLSLSNSDLEQKIIQREEQIGHLREKLRGKDNSLKQMSRDFKREADAKERNFQTLVEEEKRKVESYGKEFERYQEKREREQEAIIRGLQAEIHGIKEDRDLIQAKYKTFVRQQQEEAFKQMESARWLPPEESKVLGNFERIKRDMKSWARGTAIKDMSLIHELGEKDSADLMNTLSAVVLVQENQLTEGLSASRAPAVLLNALLAHDVFTNLFRNPFFFLKDGLGDDLPRTGPEQLLHKIYLMSQAADERDAHMWRSQTLRLLLPPLRDGCREGEQNLRSWTEGLIARVSDRHTSEFLASPARFLIDGKAIANTTKKVKTIYQEAANISYMLWTRRTTMKCITLQEMGRPTFDVENPNFVPHPLVHPENYEDRLKGRPITVIVHPLLQVFGTDEAKDYDEKRVWVPAEVWLNSK